MILLLRKIFSLGKGLIFANERVARLVQDPSLSLRAGEFTIHEGLGDLFLSKRTAAALAHDEGELVSLVGGLEDLHVLYRAPCAPRFAAG